LLRSTLAGTDLASLNSSFGLVIFLRPRARLAAIERIIAVV